MSCSDSVENFIRRYDLRAILYRYSESVESVEKASKVCGAPPSDIVKTLIVIADGKPYIAIIPGDRRLSYRKFAKVVTAKSVRMAKPEEVRTLTGFDIGGVSPLSECIRRYRVVVDQNLVDKLYVWCGGGDRYSLAYVNVKDLLDILSPLIADISEPIALGLQDTGLGTM